MMLPQLIDPRKLVTKGSALKGDTPTAKMLRLGSALVSLDKVVKTQLVFSRNEQGQSLVKGSISLGVVLECQRCLQAVHKTLTSNFQLGIVWDEEQATKLPSSLEPWVVTAESTDLVTFVEDELLLVMPIMAYHDKEDCSGTESYSTGQIKDTSENPFDILAQLKSRH